MSDSHTFGIFIELESDARAAETLEGLYYHIVNGTRRLVTCRQALVIDSTGRQPRIQAASNVDTVERRAPFIQWFERGLKTILSSQKSAECFTLQAGAFPENDAGQWADWLAPQGLWVPLTTGKGTAIGGLWLARDEPWQEAELLLLSRLGNCYGHALDALKRRGGRIRGGSTRMAWRRIVGWSFAAMIVGTLFLPVRQSVLAPAEVVPSHPFVVAAPMNGVIKEINVLANAPVEAGDLLVTFDDTTLKSQVDVAARNVEVAKAELAKVRQAAFRDPRAKAQIEIQSERVKLGEAELAYARTLLEKVHITSQSSGVAVYADRSEWAGKPVRTGEKIMTIASAHDASLRIHLPVSESIRFPDQARVLLFLSIDPLNPISAVLKRVGYEAAPTATGQLAFRVDAAFEGETPPRIGLRGTAKIFGEKVPLYLYLLRRPIAAARQIMGF